MASPSDVHMQPEPPDGVPHPRRRLPSRDTLMGFKDSSNLETDALANKLDATKIVSEPSTSESQDTLHGDWLMVSRTKKGKNKIQGKGSSPSKDNQATAGKDAEEGKASKVGQGPNNLVPKTQQDNMESDQMVFQSNALPSTISNNSRKKRHRVEASYKASSSPGQETNQALVQVNGSARDKGEVHPFGIKTSVNIDILSPNKMRFRDEDDPSI
ncbi:hypothetical protein SESBI_01352 [Sesbania bispinosa]|nr:hypothetical protein SESBI_01352 [Sesbania bispinosa]